MNDDILRAIGAEVRNLRIRAGWSGRETARRSGVSQATLSRVERGHRIESGAPVEKIIVSLSASNEIIEALCARVRKSYADLEIRRTDFGVSLVGDAARRCERSAELVREFQTAMVPRALRSPEYAQAADAFPSPLVDRLGDAGCDFGFVVTEGALRTWPADGSMMPEQLDRVARACEMANVRLGVVPWSVPLPVMPPHGFAVFDDEAVTVETFTAQMTITEPDAVAA